MKKFVLVFTFFGILLAIACQKEVTVDLPEVESKVVVDGGIFIGEFAQIALTKSSGYFDPVDSASLANLLVTNAIVTLSDGVSIDTLIGILDFSLPIPFVYKGSVITGQPGRSYTLRIVVDNTEITAQTTIPTPVALDSLWYKLEQGDSLGFIWANLNDPPALGNGYRWYTKRINRDNRFFPPFGSAFDDGFINGQDFDFAYNRGSDPAAPDDDENGERGYFRRGDSVIVRFCSIGTAEVDFFRTYESIIGNQGNPFAAPGVVRSNVQGGLGIFCGYGQSDDTLICQP
jgi:hypothetical protein